MIKIFILIVVSLVPISLVYFNLTLPDVHGRFWFTVFVIFVMIERMWETFYTSKEKEVRKYHGDWTLMLTSVMYFFTGLVVIFDFFYSNRVINYLITFLGLTIFILAGLLRYWSVKTLGDQWAIHAVGESKIMNKHTLIKHGPYKYSRHPIYLGIMLELIGIALTANAFYALIPIFFINIPLYIQRALFEERTSSKERFGEEYLLYKKEVPFMIPWHFIISKKKGG
ncbi:MAG: isoprenylcysteine carboxylmethyltransferase family protein [bacterium]